MNIPASVGVPGAALALRVRDLAPAPATRVIVNCAGRTRSIIGTRSLVNAGIHNRVAALRDGRAGFFDGRLCPWPRAGRMVRAALPAGRQPGGGNGRGGGAGHAPPGGQRRRRCAGPCRRGRPARAGRRTGGRAGRGMPDWTAAGLPVETGPVRQAAPAIDRHRRPCEGTDNKAKAMQAYLDWECGLVAGPGRHARLSRAVASGAAVKNGSMA